ncbi:MAG: protease modulator HflC [Proteobacteria bacterium]|jgi:membrane protease subunit HflC|nr:protease modulator HflC [Pseudomonadota bacterium]
MKKSSLAVLGVIAILVGVGAWTSLYTIHQTKQAVVLQFGNPVAVVQEPGLHVKLPWQDVRMYERRTLNLDPPIFELLLSDQKRIRVDAFARYRIEKPLEFLKVVGTEVIAVNRLGNIVNSALRQIIAKASLADLLSEKRANLMEQIQAEVAARAAPLGIRIIDIRIGRTDLPTETSQAVFNRMRTEREREAQELRAQGKENAQKIRAAADRDQVVILATAKRTSEQLRGEGDGERTLILGKAYGKDPEFFQFYKSLTEYSENLIGNDTTMVLSPNSDFFKFFNDINGSQKKE